MNYQISRNGQMYGPYTMEDLQRYLASGHVLLTDLAKSEEMVEWIPVSQLLAMHGATPAAAAGYAGTTAFQQQPTVVPAGAPYPDPPNLHWGLVLLLDVLTCSLFQMVWNIILAAWFKRVFPASKALVLYIASAILLLIQGATSQATGLMTGHHGLSSGYHYDFHRSYGMYGLVSSICWIVRLVTRFTFRSELEQHFNTVDPIGLRLNPVLTFFFGGIYIQSQMNRVNDIKRGLAYR